MTDKREEDRLRHMIHDLHDGIKVPDSTDSWNTLEVKLKKRRRRKKLVRRMQVTIGFVCASIVISLLITNNGNQRAHANISSFFKTIQNNIVEIFIKKPADNSENALTSPPPSGEQTNSAPNATPEKTTLAEAKKKLAFPLMLPSALPDKFSLDGVRTFREADNQYRSLYLEYSDPQGSLIKMTERLITENTGIKTEIYEGTGEIKDVFINGHPAVLMILPEGMINLEWIVEDVKISLSGVLSEAEALDWARSIQ